jgi:hypothetical protein
MEKHLKLARKLTKLMDEQFSILGFKFGLDPLIGLLPGIGDAVTIATSGYIIWIATQIGVTPGTILKMIVYTLIDFGTGLVPGAGDIIDFFWKANKRNLDLVEKHYHGQVIKD